MCPPTGRGILTRLLGPFNKLDPRGPSWYIDGPVIESVPNFSEGRRRDLGERLAAAARAAGAHVLDLEMDADHHRSVLTFVGGADAVANAAFEAAKIAVEAIDLRSHKGQHPRMGAVDVIPFVPLPPDTMAICVDIARRVGKRIGDELRVPVFLYESAATRPENRNLADIRRGEFEEIAKRELTPDFGPTRVHPTAGCVAVGARPPLIAYNVDLDTEELAVAKKIAKKIREKDGGLPRLKALGMYLGDRKCAQVSMNVCDFTVTSLKASFDAVAAEAKRLGVGVRSSEIVGLVPQAALPDAWIADLKLAGFKPDQVIERKISAL